MKFWKKPKDEHIVYEALTAIADNRIELSKESAKCYSSSRNKFYTLEYDLDKILMMSDDNMAYYRDEVSYPMLAVLLESNLIPFNKDLLANFKGIPWKDINQKNKNDYMKSVSEFLENCKEKEEVEKEAKTIFAKLLDIEIGVLGSKKIPSKEY